MLYLFLCCCVLACGCGLVFCWCCCDDGNGIGSEVGGGVSAGEVRDLEVGAFLVVGDGVEGELGLQRTVTSER